MNEYTADLSIDKYNIDTEILEQSQRSYDWAKKAAIAETERDDAKDKYDLVVVEIEELIRSDPERYTQNGKDTEGAIKSAVNSHPKVKRALRRFQKKRKIFKILTIADKKFEMRKRMIEAYLYHIHRMMDGDPKVPRKYEKRFADETRSNINKNLKKSWNGSKLRRRRKK